MTELQRVAQNLGMLKLSVSYTFEKCIFSWCDDSCMGTEISLVLGDT